MIIQKMQSTILMSHTATSCFSSILISSHQDTYKWSEKKTSRRCTWCALKYCRLIPKRPLGNSMCHFALYRLASSLSVGVPLSCIFVFVVCSRVALPEKHQQCFSLVSSSIHSKSKCENFLEVKSNERLTVELILSHHLESAGKHREGGKHTQPC